MRGRLLRSFLCPADGRKAFRKKASFHTGATRILRSLLSRQRVPGTTSWASAPVVPRRLPSFPHVFSVPCWRIAAQAELFSSLRARAVPVLPGRGEGARPVMATLFSASGIFACFLRRRAGPRGGAASVRPGRRKDSLPHLGAGGKRAAEEVMLLCPAGGDMRCDVF